MHRVIIVFLPVFTVEQFNLECITLYKSKKKNSTVSKIKYIYNTIYKRLNYPGPVWFTLVLHSCHTVCGNSQSMQRRLLKTVFVARCIRGLAAKWLPSQAGHWPWWGKWESWVLLNFQSHPVTELLYRLTEQLAGLAAAPPAISSAPLVRLLY